MKKGFTLVEIMAVLAILLIGGSLVFGVFTSSYKLINREKSLTDMQDSFRNLALDMEKEINDTDVIEYKIEGIEINNINSYESIVPILLIKKDESNILYFKGKKSTNNSEIIEKVVFDNSSINNNTIYLKESKTIINQMNGNIVLSSLVNDLIEVNCNFTIGNSEIVRNYSTTINLDKDKSEEVIEIVDGNTETTIKPETPTTPQQPVEPGIPDKPVTDAEIGEIANTFSKQSTFIVLDQNPYNSRENLINIQPISGTDNSNIDLSNATFYIQAISTEVMKKYINTNKVINNSFEKTTAITKAPSLISDYKSIGYTVNGKNGWDNLMSVKNNVRVYIENNGIKIGCIYKLGNQGIILVNGDLNINSNDANLTISSQNSQHKLTIYATGKINININNEKGILTLKNCSLISANQINIRANNINVEATKTVDVDKLKEVLDENLLKS